MLGQAKRLYELNSLFSPKAETAAGNKIISITSGKGGTGKSFIASNIASELALNGLKVLLVDLDINLANQNVLFNLTTKKSIYHYLTYNQSLEDIIHKQTENLHLIFGESGKIDHPKLTEERVINLISDLKNLSYEYDIILLDTSSGAENSIIQLLLKSDEIIFVTSPEPTSVMDAYVIFKLLKSNGSDVKANVIVNKCFTKRDAQEAFENLEKATKHFLKMDINYLGELSFSEDVVRSIQNQTPIIQSLKINLVSNQIKSISSKLRIPTIG
ncbi:MAG: AAA family ATPase [Melioribacteraceae bacterium]|nr:AAA family ATPase [Melioribacteraceae bacterium]